MADTFSEAALIADLKVWWDDQVGGEADPFSEKPSTSGTIFDVIPTVDSLGVVTGLITIEKHVGFKVPARVIRRGGYNNFEEMVADLMPKVKVLIEKKQTVGPKSKKEAA
jgi:hypothetical protein